LAAVAIASVATGLLMVSAGAAWSAPGRLHPHRPPHTTLPHTTPPHTTRPHTPRPAPKLRDGHPVLRFNVPLGEVQLTIPTPACPVSDPDCVWRLIINEPKAPGAPIVGTVTGTSGTLTLAFPTYCGVIQADAQLGPVWVQEQGIRHKIGTCTPTPTTTSTSTTATTATTASTKPPVVVAASTTPTTSGLPFTPSTTAATATAGTTAAAQLPFTGLDIRPMIILGSALILFGGLLLTTVESRRRALRRASAIRLEHLKEGTRRTSSWFLGL